MNACYCECNTLYSFQACRLLAVEVENKLTKIARIRKPRETRPPIYYKE